MKMEVRLGNCQSGVSYSFLRVVSFGCASGFSAPSSTPRKTRCHHCLVVEPAKDSRVADVKGTVSHKEDAHEAYAGDPEPGPPAWFRASHEAGVNMEKRRDLGELAESKQHEWRAV